LINGILECQFYLNLGKIICMKKIIGSITGFFMLALLSINSFAQDAYQVPPKEIADLLLAAPTPSISVDGNAKHMLVMERPSYPLVEELGQAEFKIAGLRLNPNNFSPTRQNYIKGMTIKVVATNKALAIKGMPATIAALSPTWNPSENKIAFYNVSANAVDVYVIDLTTLTCQKINKTAANLILGASLVWLDDATVMYKVNVNTASALNKRPITPKGPTIQENLGKAAPSVTYQDLIKSPYDEYVFEFLATSQLVKNKNGVETKIGAPALTNSFSISPDKNYILTRTLNKPFSYLVTAYGFASSMQVLDKAGALVKTIAQLPSSEGTASGYDNVQNAPRGFEWKDDEAATIVYAMPLDSGLIKKAVPFHDAVMAIAAPFNEAPKELFKTAARFSNISWGDATLALVTEVLRTKQRYKVSVYNHAAHSLTTLYERSLTDAYSNLGNPVTHKNKFGKDVIATVNNGRGVLMNNTTGASDKGDLPYLSIYNLDTKTNEIIWRSKEDCFEYVVDVLDAATLKIITRRETEKEVPNYYLKSLQANTSVALTSFSNPYASMEGVTKEKIKYKRADGVDLTGDLYLPKGYNKEKDGPLPTLLWAYPREFTSAADASQIRGNQHKFTLLSWGSPVFYVTQGYAILDNAEMPIVATSPDKKPNDDFVNQLILNSTAAIDKLVSMGVSDRNKFAIGGHSYGAFMTANVLAHSNLFKAGIARSGAYNRTLTPFGFQNEDRTFWQAPQLYLDMSPFAHANKIKTPILLTHGEMDDNTGTFPINSERLYAAIKGHGGTVRFVYLPYEAHGYRGKENVLHLLYEQGRWLDKYLKGK
jgi:dipeptidyl aminopeptidase/acylaminoacyl peptidase